MPSAAAPVTSAPAAPSTSITNVQIQGVDEGDIVKRAGDYLIVLRRGRIFSVRLVDSPRRARLRPADYSDSYASGVDVDSDWYDEMLVSGDWIVVIGYSYSRGGTEVNRFRLRSRGDLEFVDSYHLRSDDYYSSRNYATRLIGNRLILYSPLSIGFEGDPLQSLPALRKWDGSERATFKRIAPAQRVYVATPVRRDENAIIDTVHSVTECDVTTPTMKCASTAVLGGLARTFFVSSNAVYVWTRNSWDVSDTRPNSFLYRIPFDGGHPQAVGVRGGPIDQFSFQPDVPANRMHIMVRAGTGGDAMWAPEASAGDLALLRLPMANFGDGSGEAATIHYTPLPPPGGRRGWNIQNRFVGNYLLYGLYSPYVAAGSLQAPLTAVSVPDLRIWQLPVAHGVGRIDAMAGNAIVIGPIRQGLGLTSVSLSGTTPALASLFVLPQSREGDSRSHGFFYKQISPTEGLVGLPVLRRTNDRNDTAAVQFLSSRNLMLTAVGELAASTEAHAADDQCKASCADWYGNARPIFLDDRILALIGYEVIEGAFDRERLREIDRLDFSPAKNPPLQPLVGDPDGSRDRLTRRSFTIEVAEGVVVTKLLARLPKSKKWVEAKAEFHDGRYYAELPEVMLNEYLMACDFDLMLVLNGGARRIRRMNVEVCTLDQWLIRRHTDEMTHADKGY